MSTNDSFSWGIESLARPDPGRHRAKRSSHQMSLLGARAVAILIDGLVLCVPLALALYAMSLVFPHHGFFLSSVATSASGTTTVGTFGLGLPGALLLSALSLSYFFLFEAVRGQTVGKRSMGLRVRAAAGGPAGLNAVSARTVLRLIDALAFYLVGAFVAIVTGSRRRRLGDWLGGTVVVRDDGLDDPPRQGLRRALLYPAMWVVAVLVATFALGLGRAAGAQEGAVSLVRSYVQAREGRDGALACSMLSREQQRELVAIQTRDYRDASAARCPQFVLGSDPRSHLRNPGLVELLNGPLATRYSSLGGAVLVVSRNMPSVALLAVQEGGRLELDVRGLQRAQFVKGCADAGHISTGACRCVFAGLRDEGLLDEGLSARVLDAMRVQRGRCARATSA